MSMVVSDYIFTAFPAIIPAVNAIRERARFLKNWYTLSAKHLAKVSRRDSEEIEEEEGKKKN